MTGYRDLLHSMEQARGADVEDVVDRARGNPESSDLPRARQVVRRTSLRVALRSAGWLGRILSLGARARDLARWHVGIDEISAFAMLVVMLAAIALLTAVGVREYSRVREDRRLHSIAQCIGNASAREVSDLLADVHARGGFDVPPSSRWEDSRDLSFLLSSLRQEISLAGDCLGFEILRAEKAEILRAEEASAR